MIANQTGELQTDRGFHPDAHLSRFPPSTPTLRITQIGSLTAPAAPTGNTATPDVSFPTPPAGPVTVILAAHRVRPPDPRQNWIEANSRFKCRPKWPSQRGSRRQR